MSWVKFRHEGLIWTTIYEVVDDKYFKQIDVDFLKEFVLKFKQEFSVSQFIPGHVKKAIKKIGIE